MILIIIMLIDKDPTEYESFYKRLIDKDPTDPFIKGIRSFMQHRGHGNDRS